MGRSLTRSAHSKSSRRGRAVAGREKLTGDLRLAMAHITKDEEEEEEEEEAGLEVRLGPAPPAHDKDKYAVQKTLLNLYIQYAFHPDNTLFREFRELRRLRPRPPAAAATHLANNRGNSRSSHVLPSKYGAVLRPVAHINSPLRPLPPPPPPPPPPPGGGVLRRAMHHSYTKATVVNTGFHEFIVMRHPRPRTVPDFWRLLAQSRPSALVMFHGAKGDLAKFPRYWPLSGEQLTFLDHTTSPILVTRQPPCYTHSPKWRRTAGAGEVEASTEDRLRKRLKKQRARDRVRKERDEKRWRKECHVGTAKLRAAIAVFNEFKRRMTSRRESKRGSQEGPEERSRTKSGLSEMKDEQLRDKKERNERDERRFKGEGGSGDVRKRKEKPYQWREKREMRRVRRRQTSPHYFLTQLHVWTGYGGGGCGGGGGRRSQIPHYHFPGGLGDESALLHLLHRVLYHQSAVGGPIVVHCPDGGDLSGVFVTLARLIQLEVNGRTEEQDMEEEEKKNVSEEEKEEEEEEKNDPKGTVNVFEAVSHVRQYLPRAVRRVASYKFLYTCLREFLSSPSSRWGHWARRRVIPDHRLTTLLPLNTPRLLLRIARTYPDLRADSWAALQELTGRGRRLCHALFLQVLRRMERGGRRDGRKGMTGVGGRKGWVGKRERQKRRRGRLDEEG